MQGIDISEDVGINYTKVASFLFYIFNYIPEIIDANQMAMDDRLTTLKNIIKI